MSDNKRTALKYAVPILVGLVLSFAVMYWRGLFSETELYYIYMYISDGFFVTAAIYVGYGLLLLVSFEGALDIIGYGFKSLLYLFTPAKRNRDEGGYYEYKVRRKGKRKAVPFHILWIGIGFLVPAIIFAVLNGNL